MGVKRACPWGPPLWGREGVILAISTQFKKLEGFLMKINYSEYEIFIHNPPFTMIAAAPEGSPPRRIRTKFKKTCPPCLGEA